MFDPTTIKENKMKDYWLMTMRYLLAGEESRPGIQDYWRDGFLTAHTPFQRRCLEFSKVMVLIALSFFIMSWIFPV